MMMMLNVTPYGFDFFAKDVPAIYFLREESEIGGRNNSGGGGE